MRLRLTKPAQGNFDHAVDWFKTNRPWLVNQFLDDVREAFEQIVRTPERLPLVEVDVANTSRQWRRKILRRFCYIVVFFVAGDTVVVCIFSHTSRDWTSQLTDKDE